MYTLKNKNKIKVQSGTYCTEIFKMIPSFPADVSFNSFLSLLSFLFFFYPQLERMSSRRVLQQVVFQSLRVSAKRTVTVPVLRASIVLNNKFAPVKETRRFFNSQQPTDIFKVVDFNDIQQIIKKDGKVKKKVTKHHW